MCKAEDDAKRFQYAFVKTFLPRSICEAICRYIISIFKSLLNPSYFEIYKQNFQYRCHSMPHKFNPWIRLTQYAKIPESVKGPKFQNQLKVQNSRISLRCLQSIILVIGIYLMANWKIYTFQHLCNTISLTGNCKNHCCLYIAWHLPPVIKV